MARTIPFIATSTDRPEACFDFEAWLATDAGRTWRMLHPPIAGASVTNPPADDPPVVDPPADPPVDDPPVDDPPVDDPPEDDPPETMTAEEAKAIRDENARLKREQGEAKKAQAKAEREAKRAKEKNQAEQGQYKDLYEQSEREKADVISGVKKSTLKAAIITAASNANFRDPNVAAKLLDLEADDIVDDDYEVDGSAITRAIDALAKEHAYLVRPKQPQRDELGGGNRRRPRGNAPPSDDNPANWNPADTMRSAYDNAGAG